MAIYRGPNVVTDGLVFGYDADDRSTRFYKGEPTVNVVANSQPTGGWTVGNAGGSTVSVSYGVEESIPYMKLSGIINAADYPRVYDSVFTSTVTGDVTLSFEAKGTPGANILFRIYESGTTRISQDVYVTSEWQRYTYTVNTAYILNQPYFNPRTTGAEYYIRNIQVEQKNHATQFVNGSRTVTNALIDLKKTTTINLSNVSFDSTAHPMWDGLDDYIEVPNGLLNYANGFTLEAIVSPTNAGENTYGRIFDKTDNITSTGAGMFMYMNGGVQQAFFQINNAGGLVVDIPFLTYSHIVISVASNGGAIIYVNGVQKAWGTTALPSTITTTYPLRIGNRSNNTDRTFNGKIPVAKIYNRVLTSTEAQQNFNSYKYRFNIQ